MKNLEQITKVFNSLQKLKSITSSEWSILIYGDESGHITHMESNIDSPFEDLEDAKIVIEKEIAFFNSLLHNKI
jgi:phage-related protein